MSLQDAMNKLAEKSKVSVEKTAQIQAQKRQQQQSNPNK